MTYSAEGFGKLSRNYHDAYRSNLIRSKYVDQPRPVLVNNWEATYFDFDADKLYHIAEEAKNIGLDMFVLDDGWFEHTLTWDPIALIGYPNIVWISDQCDGIPCECMLEPSIRKNYTI